MTSLPPISILHRFFRYRFTNSRDVVPSSPSFSRPAAKAPRRACSQTTETKQTNEQKSPQESSIVGVHCFFCDDGTSRKTPKFLVFLRLYGRWSSFQTCDYPELILFIFFHLLYIRKWDNMVGWCSLYRIRVVINVLPSFWLGRN